MMTAGPVGKRQDPIARIRPPPGVASLHGIYPSVEIAGWVQSLLTDERKRYGSAASAPGADRASAATAASPDHFGNHLSRTTFQDGLQADWSTTLQADLLYHPLQATWSITRCRPICQSPVQANW